MLMFDAVHSSSNNDCCYSCWHGQEYQYSPYIHTAHKCHVVIIGYAVSVRYDSNNNIYWVRLHHVINEYLLK